MSKKTNVDLMQEYIEKQDKISSQTKKTCAELKKPLTLLPPTKIATSREHNASQTHSTNKNNSTYTKTNDTN